MLLNITETRKMKIHKLKKNYFIPRDKETCKRGREERFKWFLKKLKTKPTHINNFSFNCETVKNNIENLIGVAQVPLAIAGPLKVNGQHAKGIYYVPLATTEATLVASYEIGMAVITKSGGANVRLVKDEISVSPMFILPNYQEGLKLKYWMQKNLVNIKKIAESTTRYGKLKRIEYCHLGNKLILTFWFSTSDAMGMNMINIAAEAACKFIIKKYSYLKKIPYKYYLRSNFSSDKKPSFFNLLSSYGKELTAEVIIPKELIRGYWETTPEEMHSFWESSIYSSIQAGMVGINAHYANALAAIFIACGQDVAQVVNASIGISGGHITKQGDIYVFAKIPCLPIATIGGGTSLSTQKECLQLLDCYGKGKSKKFAEIIAATILAGEISICAALASNSFIKAHLASRNR